jgi:hypothetical protein
MPPIKITKKKIEKAKRSMVKVLRTYRVVSPTSKNYAIDPISLSHIPTRFSVQIGKRWYDKRQLKKWFLTGRTNIPNTRQVANKDLYKSITGKPFPSNSPSPSPSRSNSLRTNSNFNSNNERAPNYNNRNAYPHLHPNSEHFTGYNSNDARHNAGYWGTMWSGNRFDRWRRAQGFTGPGRIVQRQHR